MPTKLNTNGYATKGDLQELRQATRADMRELRGNINEDIKTNMGVLYEKFSDEVWVVAESHQDTRREVKNLGVKVDMLIETVSEIKVDVSEIKDEPKNKADLKDHKLLGKRVSVLEAVA